MSFDWANYAVLADELRTLSCRGGVEARLRSSMSRGYYGMFHLVRLFLANEGVKISSNVDAHQEVVQALQTSADRRRRKLGLDLSAMRKYRNRDDYDDEIGNVAQMESESSKTRELIRAELERLNPG